MLCAKHTHAEDSLHSMCLRQAAQAILCQCKFECGTVTWNQCDV